MLNVRGLHKWTRGLLVASLVALGLAAPARAGNIVNFDPTGGIGANPNNVLATSSFAYLPGNALAKGGTPLGSTPIPPGADTHVLYQAILGSINTAGANSAALGGNNGNITILPGGGGSSNTGVQIVITAEFTEKTASATGGSPATTLTFAPDFAALGGVNSVKIYAQPSGNANINSSNAGVNQYPGPGSTLILTGHLLTTGFTSSFNADPASFTTPVALNQHTGGSGDYSGITTITGSGNTSITVAVDSYSTSYFLTPVLTLIGLNFNTISSGLPFRAVDPALQMFTTYVPSIGAVNGEIGPDLLLQSQANNDFTLSPEPGTIAMALTGIGIGALAGLRNLRRRNASLTA